MKPVHITTTAKHDLAEIHEYIAAENGRAADALLDRIERTLELIELQPGLGTLRDDLRRGIRTTVVGQYVLIYVERAKRTDIVRVLHGARDMRSLFKPSSH